jgi:rRNA maturation endonuclease Nob1
MTKKESALTIELTVPKGDRILEPLEFSVKIKINHPNSLDELTSSISDNSSINVLKDAIFDIIKHNKDAGAKGKTVTFFTYSYRLGSNFKTGVIRLNNQYSGVHECLGHVLGVLFLGIKDIDTATNTGEIIC